MLVSWSLPKFGTYYPALLCPLVFSSRAPTQMTRTDQFEDRVVLNPSLLILIPPHIPQRLSTIFALAWTSSGRAVTCGKQVQLGRKGKEENPSNSSGRSLRRRARETSRLRCHPRTIAFLHHRPSSRSTGSHLQIPVRTDYIPPFTSRLPQ